MSNIFDRRESEVRSYCRSFPVVFDRAEGAILFGENGREYIDFFAGAGTMNYGHNHPLIKEAVLKYLERNGIAHSLDMWTVAKRNFLETFEEVILDPRGFDYKIQFTGPTGTNAVEAALKLARKVKKRSNIVAFTNGYHGLSAGALAVTGNRHFRTEEFINRTDADFLPFDGYLGPDINTLDYIERVFEDSSSGVDIPAAIILETVQAEGGVRVASDEWLRGIERVCRKHDILLIIDDIQVGNGRTGSFFSFESAGLNPDIVVLSKAIGGLGTPMSIVLMKPELDVWKPAEHTGTFRGNNLAFVGATAALQLWRDPAGFEAEIQRKALLIDHKLKEIQQENPNQGINIRGKGLIKGMAIDNSGHAKSILKEAFQNGLIVELAGPNDEVVKFLPPLTIDDATLNRGLEVFHSVANNVFGSAVSRKAAVAA